MYEYPKIGIVAKDHGNKGRTSTRDTAYYYVRQILNKYKSEQESKFLS